MHLCLWMHLIRWAQTKLASIGLSSSARDCQISRYLNYLWSQIIQLICVFLSPKLQLAGYLVEISSKISWASLQNIPLFVRCVLTSPKTRTMPERWTNILSSSFEVKSQADEDLICNFGIISQIRNCGLFGNLEMMNDRPNDSWGRHRSWYYLSWVQEIGSHLQLKSAVLIYTWLHPLRLKSSNLFPGDRLFELSLRATICSVVCRYAPALVSCSA